MKVSVDYTNAGVTVTSGISPFEFDRATKLVTSIEKVLRENGMKDASFSFHLEYQAKTETELPQPARRLTAA